MNFSGFYAATLTPFNKDESINYEEIQKLVKFNCETGLKGLYVGGSTAEAFLCSTEERIDVLKATAEVASSSQATLIAT